MAAGSETDVRCACGHTFKVWIWQSANVTQKPDLKKTILEGNMNVVRCPSCGARFHVEIPFLYHDMKRKEWIWVYPVGFGADAGHVNDEVEAMWEKITAAMPPALRETIERNYKTMLVFGMDALVHYLKHEPAKEGGSRASGNQSTLDQ